MCARTIITRLASLVSVTMLLAGTSAAQTKVGTTFGAFTLIEPDARLAAMGNAGTASAEGLAGAFHNAAAAAGTPQRALEFVHTSWLAGIRHDWIAYAHPTRFGAIYGTFTSLNSGDMTVRTVNQPLGTGERFARSLDVKLADKVIEPSLLLEEVAA